MRFIWGEGTARRELHSPVAAALLIYYMISRYIKVLPISCKTNCFDDVEKLKELHGGRWQRYGYPSRSEAELALVCKLVYYGFSKSEIWRIMDNSGIGKWQEKPEGYKELTYNKALEFTRRVS